MPTLADQQVGAVGFGLMGFTWRPTQTADEQAFAAMKAALASGCNFWNSGEFYGYPEPTLNLQLVRRYFTRYPEDAARVVLSVKGAADLRRLAPDGSPAFVRQSVDNVLRLLGGSKALDVFECARVDPATPVEVTVQALAELVKEGKIKAIGLSECSATTIRRAAKVHPIAGVEVEVSLWATEIFDNGVADACRELDIPIIAYSPLGLGFLTGQFKSVDDLPENDYRRGFARFQPGNFEKNLELVRAVEALAAQKGVTAGQLAIGWVLKKGEQRGQVIIPLPGTTRKERVEENAKPATLTDADMKTLDDLLASFEVAGVRYDDKHQSMLFGDSKEL